MDFDVYGSKLNLDLILFSLDFCSLTVCSTPCLVPSCLLGQWLVQ